MANLEEKTRFFSFGNPDFPKSIVVPPINYDLAPFVFPPSSLYVPLLLKVSFYAKQHNAPTFIIPYQVVG